MSHSLKITEAWEMHSITHWWVTCYHIFTKAGYFRGGKIYSQDKIFRVLSGEIEFISSPDKGLGVNDTYEILTPESWEKIIPAWVPHIFRAVTDCVFIESFSENAENEKYERYKKIKK